MKKIAVVTQNNKLLILPKLLRQFVTISLKTSSTNSSFSTPIAFSVLTVSSSWSSIATVSSKPKDPRRSYRIASGNTSHARK